MVLHTLTSAPSSDGRTSVSINHWEGSQAHQTIDLTVENTIDDLGKDHKFTQLLIDHTGIDPDDAFSKVPYEKGFHMVYYLDRLVGRKNFDKFIPYYFTKWTNKSLDSYEFKATFLEFFDRPEYADLKDKIAQIDWEGRFYSPGMPPKPDFDTSLIDACYKLADQWKKKVRQSLEYSSDPILRQR